MLDQNTDRMWYVIGAVLVGAAIILIANGALPQMFASVAENFENVATDSIGAIDEEFGETRNLITMYDVHMNKRVRNTDGKLLNDSIEITTNYMSVSEGSKYVFSTPRAITKRIAFYSDTNEESFIIGDYIGSSKDWKKTAPEGAKYARISADYKNGNDAALDDWHFGKSK